MVKNPKERGLGKGLGALFEERTPVPVNPQLSQEEDKSGKSKSGKQDRKESQNPREDQGDKVIYIGINDIKPNANQPRKNFDEEKIEDLAASIISHGIIQPLIVRKSKVGYEIVAGERRYRASRKAGLKQVPCIVREFTDRENMLIAIIENMQREDLDPVEEAEGLNQMIKTYGLTQEEVSKSVGKSRPYITNALRLLNLSEKIKAMLASGVISPGHGRALLSIKDEKKREVLAKRIEKEGLSVRETERISTTIENPRPRPKKRQKSREIRSVEDELKRILGTRVNIEGRGHKGVVELEYYSTEELNRLIDILRSVKDI